jgi:hypothetical protein
LQFSFRSFQHRRELEPLFPESFDELAKFHLDRNLLCQSGGIREVTMGEASSNHQRIIQAREGGQEDRCDRGRTLLAERGAGIAAARGMTERLNAGRRRRMREDRDRRQALNAGMQAAA